jgi:hypothetical protein
LELMNRAAARTSSLRGRELAIVCTAFVKEYEHA